MIKIKKKLTWGESMFISALFLSFQFVLDDDIIHVSSAFAVKVFCVVCYRPFLHSLKKMEL
jgi:hypothetical protein